MMTSAATDLRNVGFWRGAAVRPVVRLANPEANAAGLVALLKRAAGEGADFAVAPELALSGYTCGDLFFQESLLGGCLRALGRVLEATAALRMVFAVGLPLRVGGRLFNAAAVCTGGKVLGVVLKSHLARRGEFYEGRHFSPARACDREEMELCGCRVPVGADLVFSTGEGAGELSFGVEICEDLWAVEPPSGRLALGGARVIVNLSASPEVLGKAAYRRQLIEQQSARCLAGYLYVSSGPGESCAELVYGGHCLAAENGRLLAEGGRFSEGPELLLVDFDVEFLTGERLRHPSFAEARPVSGVRHLRFSLPPPTAPRRLRREFSRMPFVPEDPARRAEHCREIFSIQAAGLARRVERIGARRLVVGVSGGLDSTLAVLVAKEALGALGRTAAELLAVTMPGPGTSERTLRNARLLARLTGAEVREIPIHVLAREVLDAIGHPGDARDVAFENTQARLRTLLLMNLANKEGGLVVGTGDLSEAALGWCTYNGDHMSMYHVNAGVPKTLVRYVIEWCAAERFSGELAEVLRDITATPISPELLPPDASGEVAQRTEDILGPYEVHDFFLFHMVRRGARPGKLLTLADIAFAGVHPPEALRRWWGEFARRFFASQFKRDTQPNAPKVGTVALSPRGDWRMPSDAEVALWMELPTDATESGAEWDEKKSQ